MDIIIVNWTGDRSVKDYIGGVKIEVKENNILGKKRLSIVNTKEGFPVVVFRPFYKKTLSVKNAELSFIELWEYIKKHPKDPVTSISFYVSSQYPDAEALEAVINSKEALIDLQLMDKLYVLTCPCTDGSSQKGYPPNFSKERYSILNIYRVSCTEALWAEERVFRRLMGFGRNPYFTHFSRKPFFISE